MKKLFAAMLLMLLILLAMPAQAAQLSELDWGQAYLAYVMTDDAMMWDEGYRYSLIDVNGDDVLELVCDSGVEAGGCQILTYADGMVDVLQTDRLGFTYLEGENLLNNSGGHMGVYYDYLYTIEKDIGWVYVAEGYYEGDLGEWDEETGRWICQRYFWNGLETTMQDYMDSLSASYDMARAVKPEVYYSIDELASVDVGSTNRVWRAIGGMMEDLFKGQDD